jgi:hypothetical protein
LAKSDIYKITVIKWNEHNPSSKKNYKKTMIANNLISDAKINALPTSNKWLFLALLLICGDHSNDTVTMTERQLNDILTTREGAHNALTRLQQFQLVTFEKQALNELKERKELKELKRSSSEVTKTDQDLNKKIWESYRESYFQRYKVEPVRNASVNAKISQLGKRVGDDALEIVKFYLQHNDGFYLKNLHSIGLCLKDCESLHTQWKRGRAITGSTIKSFEKDQSTRELLERIEREGI